MTGAGSGSGCGAVHPPGRCPPALGRGPGAAPGLQGPLPSSSPVRGPLDCGRGTPVGARVRAAGAAAGRGQGQGRTERLGRGRGASHGPAQGGLKGLGPGGGPATLGMTRILSGSSDRNHPRWGSATAAGLAQATERRPWPPAGAVVGGAVAAPLGAHRAHDVGGPQGAVGLGGGCVQGLGPVQSWGQWRGIRVGRCDHVGLLMAGGQQGEGLSPSQGGTTGPWLLAGRWYGHGQGQMGRPP